MAKGVSKVAIAFNEINEKIFSRSGNYLSIEPAKMMWFKVSEWFAGTTDDDKKKGTIWIRQSSDRLTVINKKPVGYGQVYGFQISKKECGASAYFYIEATSFGSRDFRNKTGLYVKGYTPALIINSKWCTQNDGEDRRKRKFSFGENIYLGLETEGLNQQTVTVELYRLNSEITAGKVFDRVFDKNYDPTKDDAKAKVFEKQAKVTSGEINTDFTIQPSWKKGMDDNLFYVRVRDGKKYIADSRNQYVHARYLTVHNKIVPIVKNIEKLHNNTPVKIGPADKNLKVAHLCTFKQINIDDNGENFQVFDEGKTTLQKTSPVSIHYF